MKKIARWQFFGFLFTVVVGSLLHFLFDWTGKSLFVAPFSAVNESTWEHLKLLFIPSFLFACIQSFFMLNAREDFWCVKLVGTLCGIILIPVLFYTYNGAFGKSPDWLNILFFLVAAASAYFLELLLFNRKALCKFSVGCFILLCVVAFLFVIFTFFPPKLPLFQDPITKLFGIF